MKVLKFLVVLLSIFTLLVFSYGYLSENEVIETIVDYYKRTPSTIKYNEYKKDINIDFIKLTDNFIADSKNDIINIYYTIIYSGMNEFTFYCDKNYTNCTEDVVSVNNDTSALSQMNNFVNVYNSFKSIKTTYTSTGKITLSIDRIYNSDDIINISNRINEIYDEIVDLNKDDKTNIKSIHDYIINNTKYNVEEENAKEPTASSTANGVLFNGLATCNGYTDAMSLFLDKMNIPNVRISNSTHIWNLVYLDNNWYHLDLTWDDPVNNLNKDLLVYDYYLKTSNELVQIDSENNKGDHIYNSEIYNFIN